MIVAMLTVTTKFLFTSGVSASDSTMPVRQTVAFVVA